MYRLPVEECMIYNALAIRFKNRVGLKKAKAWMCIQQSQQVSSDTRRRRTFHAKFLKPILVQSHDANICKKSVRTKNIFDSDGFLTFSPVSVTDESYSELPCAVSEFVADREGEGGIVEVYF